MQIGYFLSSEEHTPQDLLAQARHAERVGMEHVWVSDHFHPWVDEQGHSPFVWSVIGGIAAQTTRLTVGTAVSCPTIRIHPAILAQATATSAVMLDGRFEFGVGSGENLNEHVLGDRWPIAGDRLEMLEEAVEVIRKLWTGEQVTHRGEHYRVENARIYTCPDSPPPVLVSAFGDKATSLAAKIGDGFVSTHPDREHLDQYRSEGGLGPASATLRFCWGPDAQACAQLAHRLWRSSGVPGVLSQDLATPAHFEQAARLVTVESVAESMPCGPDLERIVEAVAEYADAGFDRLYISQVGPDQDAFFAMYESELGPRLATV